MPATLYLEGRTPEAPLMLPAPKKVMPSGIEFRILCARFCERIQKYYEDPENERRFQEWKRKRDAERAAAVCAAEKTFDDIGG